MSEKYSSSKEIAELLNVKVATIFRWIATENLPYFSLGKKKKLLFLESEVIKWLKRKTKLAKKGAKIEEREKREEV